MSLMKRVLLVAAVGVGLQLSLVWGAEEKAKDPKAEPQAAAGQNAPSADEIAKLVEQLDAERYSDRQTASEKLAAAGKTAIPALAKAAVGESLEVTVRSLDILKKFLESADEPTKTAAKAALETIAKSDRASAARRAQDAIKPKEEPRDPNVGPAGGIIIGGGNIIQGRVQIIAGGANAKSVTVKNVNGVKEIDVEENGKKIKIHDDPQQGIKIEITTKKDGKDVTDKYEAKDADELKKKHPEAHKIYEEYGKNQGGIGVFQIQIGQGGILPAVPIPVQPGNVPVPARLGGANAGVGQIAATTALLKSLTRRLEMLTKDEQLPKASQQAKDELNKQLAELKQQIAELEKRLAEKPKPAEEKKEKPAVETPRNTP